MGNRCIQYISDEYCKDCFMLGGCNLKKAYNKGKNDSSKDISFLPEDKKDLGDNPYQE